MTPKRRRIDAYEEVDYEPMTVLEIVREMKDLSELMVDLAYSAVILDNDPMGEQVEALAARMDWLKYHLRQAASLAVRTPDEAAQVSGILQVGDASEHVANAASDMMEILEANIATKPFLRHALEDADDRITVLKVPEESPAIGPTLGEVGLETVTGVRVLAIQRGKRWLYDPDQDDKLRAADTLILRGQREGAARVRAWLRGEEAL